MYSVKGALASSINRAISWLSSWIFLGPLKPSGSPSNCLSRSVTVSVVAGETNRWSPSRAGSPPFT